MPAEFQAHPWILDIEVAAEVVVPPADVLDRDGFCGWLWAEWGDAGLLGVDEGSMDVAEAAERGIVATHRVIDAAAAPADRDWMAQREVATLACWFADEATARAAGARLLAFGGVRAVGVRPAPAETAADDWRSGFSRIDIPGFGAVLPAWEAGEAGHDAVGTTVFIDPGVGFGTGDHETTRLCLAALADWQRSGGSLGRVLDFGSGSGILAIAAAVRGTGVVDAVEIDPLVHDAIRANAARNGVADRVRVAARMPDATAAYDLVIANIVAPVLLEHAEPLCGRLRRPGCVVLSGLLAADVAPVADRYQALLGSRPTISVAGEWHCLTVSVGTSVAPARSGRGPG